MEDLAVSAVMGRIDQQLLLLLLLVCVLGGVTTVTIGGVGVWGIPKGIYNSDSDVIRQGASDTLSNYCKQY